MFHVNKLFQKLEHTSEELCLVRKDPKKSLAITQEAVTKVKYFKCILLI